MRTERAKKPSLTETLQGNNIMYREGKILLNPNKGEQYEIRIQRSKCS